MGTGMDSTRSGLLSTLIMTVPLIVVPAIALLRPAVPTSGISTNSLEASAESEDALFSEFDEFSEDSFGNTEQGRQKTPDPAAAEDYSAWFEEVTEIEPDAESGVAAVGAAATPDSGFPQDPFAEPSPPAPASRRNGTSTPGPANPPTNDENRLQEQISALGATRTIWFTPGQTAGFGFVAFVPGETREISYRFEAIGRTRADAVRQVYDQIVHWRVTRPDRQP